MIKVDGDENILLIKRRHFFVLWKKVAPLIALGTFGLAILIASPWIDYPKILTDQAIFPFAVTFILIILWNIGFHSYTNYYLDSWIITNRRTIHTELKSLFSREQSSVKHNRVQDVTVTVVGIIPTMLGYGDLTIQTAGSFRNFVFAEIPEPYKTKEYLNKLIRESRKNKQDV
jgi:uncharacterized membrane protein YdbT with pleckstrin-like domain